MFWKAAAQGVLGATIQNTFSRLIDDRFCSLLLSVILSFLSISIAGVLRKMLCIYYNSMSLSEHGNYF